MKRYRYNICSAWFLDIRISTCSKLTVLVIKYVIILQLNIKSKYIKEWTRLYHKNQDCCYFPIHTKGITGHGKDNLPSKNVENIDFLMVCFNHFYTLKDSKVLSTFINKISHSNEVLIYTGIFKDLRIKFSTVCLYRLCGKWILSSTSIIMNFCLRIVCLKYHEKQQWF